MIHQSYEYRYIEPPPPELLRLVSVGRQTVERPDYAWDGAQRNGDGIIFQYTLSGEGKLDWEGNAFSIAKGQALIVPVPGKYRYYYDACATEPWSFIWIRLAGGQAASIWREWHRSEGPASDFRLESETIAKLFAFYADAASGRLGDMWSISVRLYDWLLTLVKRFSGSSRHPQDIPETYALIAAWIEEHYADDIALAQLAEMAGVTKHHFCKKFQELYRLPPIQYIRKRRIEEAAALLRTSRIPIAEIAERCGIPDPGYFGKVFRQFAGVSPSEYRISGAMNGMLLKLL